jgi:hypothetical protein
MTEDQIKAKFEAIRISLAKIETEIVECRRILRGSKE